MPTNYNDDTSLELYIDCLGKLHALLLDSDAIHALIVGDFNCSPGSKFFPDFAKFSEDNNLITTDLIRLQDVVTYISDDGCNTSWLDHILSSNAVDRLIHNINVLYDVIVSDHRPLSFSVQCNINTKPYNATLSDTFSVAPRWSSCDDGTLSYYAKYLDHLLCDINVPYTALYDKSSDKYCSTLVDKFYGDIIQCITKAVADVILRRKCFVSSLTYLAGTHMYRKSTRPPGKLF